jgi:hypothetical protein
VVYRSPFPDKLSHRGLAEPTLGLHRLRFLLHPLDAFAIDGVINDLR